MRLKVIDESAGMMEVELWNGFVRSSLAAGRVYFIGHRLY